MTPPHPAIRLVAFVLAVLVLAAVLAPAFFIAGHAAAQWIEARDLAGQAPFAYLHKVAVESPFTRYFNRAVLVAALVLIWPFGRWLGVRRSDWLLRRDERAWRDLGVGFALAAGLLLAMGTGLCVAELYRFKDDPRIVSALVRATTTAAGVAVLEEFLFRGLLFSLLLRSMRERPALWVLSIVFALVHFLEPQEGLDQGDGITWASGFHLLTGIGAHFLTPDFLLAEFLVLLGVGLVLGWARLRTGTLWLPIGMHAGWVFGIFVFRGIATGTEAVKSGTHLPWIGENLRTGLVPLVAIAVTALLVRLYLRGRRPATTRTPAATP